MDCQPAAGPRVPNSPAELPLHSSGRPERMLKVAQGPINFKLVQDYLTPRPKWTRLSRVLLMLLSGSSRTEGGAGDVFSDINLMAHVVASSGLFGTWSLFFLCFSCGLP